VQAQIWVKTIPGRGWFPALGFYGPKEAYFWQDWQLNDRALQWRHRRSRAPV